MEYRRGLGLLSKDKAPKTPTTPAPGLLSNPGPNLAQPTIFPQYTSGAWANLPTGTGGAPPATPPATPAPPFTPPTGHNLVATGPTGIPTFRPIAASPSGHSNPAGLLGGLLALLRGGQRR